MSEMACWQLHSEGVWHYPQETREIGGLNAPCALTWVGVGLWGPGLGVRSFLDEGLFDKLSSLAHAAVKSKGSLLHKSGGHSPFSTTDCGRNPNIRSFPLPSFPVPFARSGNFDHPLLHTHSNTSSPLSIVQ